MTTSVREAITSTVIASTTPSLRQLAIEAIQRETGCKAKPARTTSFSLNTFLISRESFTS
jgi:hypothetical protein